MYVIGDVRGFDVQADYLTSNVARVAERPRPEPTFDR
jgi:hypothetical protein